MLLDALGPAWTAEYALSLGKQRAGYPSNYKLDLALPERRICIEVDGYSHHSRKALDAKKDNMLRSMGWAVLRFWNQDILAWEESGRPAESGVSAALERHGICLSAPARVEPNGRNQQLSLLDRVG